jgi:hypothetical protein
MELVRKCRSCQIEKAIIDFPKAHTPRFATQRYLSKCKFCTNLYVHDLTYDLYLRLKQNQDHKCALCLCDLDRVQIHIDHDHGTGYIRGILCRNCNTHLGVLEKGLDGISVRLENIDFQLDYLERQKVRLLRTKDYLNNPPFKAIKE